MSSVENTQPEVTLRLANGADAGRLQTLAALDSARVPSGPVLIAEVDGRIRAALPLDGGEPIADPFRRSADLVALLRTRAAQLAGHARPSTRRGRSQRRRPRANALSALKRRSAGLRPSKPLA